LQLGAQSTDVIMLVMNKRGVDRLLSDKFTIGAEASAAAGPTGRDAKADTDILMTAEILSWSRTRGVFAGVALDGTVVQSDKSEKEKLYGKPAAKEILQADVKPPPAARVLLSGEIRVRPLYYGVAPIRITVVCSDPLCASRLTQAHCFVVGHRGTVSEAPGTSRRR
jgi:hypothetical protein